MTSQAINSNFGLSILKKVSTKAIIAESAASILKTAFAGNTERICAFYSKLVKSS